MELYSVAIGNIPLHDEKESERIAKVLNDLEGFVAVHPHYPEGTLLFFESKNMAIIGRNVLNSEGIMTGRHICLFDWDKEKEEVSFIRGID